MQNKTRWSLTLAAILLAACGGGEQPPIATITANSPQAVRAASVAGGQGLAIRVYQALYGQAPGNAQLSDFHSQIGSGNGFTWANSVASSFNNLSNTALSTLVLNNISITPTSLTSTAAFGTSLQAYTALQGALADYFGWAGMDSRGIVIVQLSEIISNLEIDTQFGVYGNAAATFNRQTSANLNYSSNPANIISATLALATVNASSARSVAVGQQVVLDGTGSAAASGAAITYSWTLTTRPAGSAATLSSLTSGRPTFTPDIAGTYVATLIVNDGVANSNPASVSITAVANAAPVANAGVARNVVLSSVVTLDGSASSDANSDPLTYAWTLTSRPSGSSAALSSATSAKPTFTADVAGTYLASLTVNDGKVTSTAATVSIAAIVAGGGGTDNGGVSGVKSVNLTPGSVSAHWGKTVQVSAQPTDAAGATVIGQTITYTSSDTTVATVSGTGLVTLLNPGTTHVTATAAGVASNPSVINTKGFALASLSVMNEDNCALDDTRTEILCWGDGYPISQNLTLELQYPSPMKLLLGQIPGGTTLEQVGPGFFYSCALTSYDTVYCWKGAATSAVEISGMGTNSQAPVGQPALVLRGEIPVGAKITKLIQGDYSSCVLVDDGNVYCWGRVDHSPRPEKLWASSTSHYTYPVKISVSVAGVKFVDYAKGSNYDCGLSDAGQVYCGTRGSTSYLTPRTHTSSEVSLPSFCVSLNRGR